MRGRREGVSLVSSSKSFVMLYVRREDGVFLDRTVSSKLATLIAGRVDLRTCSNC